MLTVKHGTYHIGLLSNAFIKYSIVNAMLFSPSQIVSRVQTRWSHPNYWILQILPRISCRLFKKSFNKKISNYSKKINWYQAHTMFHM